MSNKFKAPKKPLHRLAPKMHQMASEAGMPLWFPNTRVTTIALAVANVIHNQGGMARG